MNYRKLGDVIKLVDERNIDGSITNLLGVSIDKHFMPSVANVIGTDLAKYKVVRKDRFACSLMQVSRDHKMPISRYSADEPSIISPAYVMFEIIGYDVLPEYLELWTQRTEFDREADFYAVGGVRGNMTWDELQGMSLVIPSIECQREIIARYHAIDARIKVLEQLNDKLAAAAQAFYNDSFNLNKQNCHFIEGTLGDIATFYDSKRIPLSGEKRAKMQGQFPYYGAVSVVDYVNDYLFDGEYVLLSEDGVKVVDENGHPTLQHVKGKFWLNNHAHILKGRAGFSEASLFVFLSNTNMAPIVTGAAQPKINQANLKAFPILIPDRETLGKFNEHISPLFDLRLLNTAEIEILERTRRVLMSDLGS